MEQKLDIESIKDQLVDKFHFTLGEGHDLTLDEWKKLLHSKIVEEMKKEELEKQQLFRKALKAKKWKKAGELLKGMTWDLKYKTFQTELFELQAVAVRAYLGAENWKEAGELLQTMDLEWNWNKRPTGKKPITFQSPECLECKKLNAELEQKQKWAKEVDRQLQAGYSLDGVKTKVQNMKIIGHSDSSPEKMKAFKLKYLEKVALISKLMKLKDQQKQVRFLNQGGKMTGWVPKSEAQYPELQQYKRKQLEKKSLKDLKKLEKRVEGICLKDCDKLCEKLVKLVFGIIVFVVTAFVLFFIAKAVFKF